MDNKQFPNPEEEILPQGPDSPAEAENGLPEFQELVFASDDSEELPSFAALNFSQPLSEDAPAEPEDVLEDPVPEMMEPLVIEPALPQADLPEEAPAEDIPVPAEQTPAQPLPAEEEHTPAELPTAEIPAEEIPAEEIPVEEIPAEEIPAEEIPAQEAPTLSFMERIPDVDEDYPPDEDEDLVVIPDDLSEVPDSDIPTVEAIADQEYRDNGVDPDVAAAQAQQPAKQNRPPRKGRPKCKKGEGFWGIPNILATFVWLGLIVAIGVTAGRMLWVCAADVLAFGRADRPVTITIYASDTMDSITDKLYDAGLIRYKSLFSLYASISDAEEDIKPGIYDLNTRYDYHALVNFMTPRSNREVIELTIPEGYTCRQIFQLLEENRVCTAVDVAAYAASGELDDYWFLEGLERGSEYCLEGYLFPDTYEFYKNSTPREALQKMLNNFENRFSEEMRAQLDVLNANVTDGSYTIREVTIVASLIEKETAAPGESSRIAGVIYNRLFRWEGVPAYLNIDAAIVYAQGGDTQTIDTSIDSPYNTYTHVGLTPTPIANPGLASLRAALDPENHDYYYYVLNPATGMHQFSTTQEEHNAWIKEFYG